MISFYLIRDKKSGLYLYNKYHKKATADVNTECRLVSEANAHAVIRDLQAGGADVTNLEVVPVELKLHPAIAANARVTKAGFYIKMTAAPGPYSRGVMYWKGNKKAPKMDWSSITSGPKSPETATRFDTRAAAEAALATCKETLATARKFFENDPYYREYETSYAKGKSKVRRGQIYIDDIDTTVLEIVEVK